MENEPLVSVITIFLNGEPFIAEAIESVFQQTYSNWELLLVDDGSTDCATSIAKDWVAKFPDKVRYFEHQDHQNRGMSASRNLGLRNARGQLVSYLDADDVWRPDKLTDQVRLLHEHPEAAYVYGPLELWKSWTGRPSDHDEIQNLGLIADRIVQPPELLTLFLRNDKNIPSGILVRAEILERMGRYDETYTDLYDDLVMHAKICLSHPVYASSKSWYRYRQHPNSCNAKAWRTGQIYQTTRRFLRWLEGYLTESGAAQGEVWKTVQAQLKTSEPKVSDHFRRTANRAQRLGKRIWKRLHRAVEAPPVILCYHRVFNPEIDLHLLAVRPQNFRQHLEVIRRIAQPMSLDDITNGARPRHAVVLTFDDGYVDNLENALPRLREFAVPATIFIATGFVGTDREFWWDDLERLVLGSGNFPEILRLQINGRQRRWRLRPEGIPNRLWNVYTQGDWTPRQKLFVDLHAALRPLTVPLQQDALRQLRAITGTTDTTRKHYRCMTASELQSLATEPLITLGAHTITHCDLDYRTPEEQTAEIKGSRLQLEAIIGRPVEHFSYPYGSFNGDAIAACARLGFRSAVSGIERPVGKDAPRECLPRFQVRDWDGREFEQRLRRFFRG